MNPALLGACGRTVGQKQTAFLSSVQEEAAFLVSKASYFLISGMVSLSCTKRIEQ